MFIGREHELSELRDKISNNRFESILLYGRRRVGKTALIKKVFDEFEGPKIYYEAKRSLIGDNVEGLSSIIKKAFNINYSFSNIRDCLSFVFDYSQTHKTLLVIDEFPFIWEQDPLIVSDIRDLIDEYKMKSSMKLIISGSYVDMMKSLNDGASETYGRFTSILEIKTFDYFESSLFYPNYTNEDKVLMYSIFGGIAFFNSLIDNRITALENIKKLILSPHSILQLEIENAISSETNKIEYVNSVIEIIGSGKTKYSDISSILSSKGSGKVNPDYILKKLQDLEIIEKVSPINDKTNKKRTFYRFKDNLIEFYYKFIYRNKNMNSIMSVDDFYDEFIRDELTNEFIPKKFEKISSEFLIRASKNHLLNNIIYDIGTYSHDDQKRKINRQFDVVTQDKFGYISYECKYTNEKINNKIIDEEEKQIIDSGLNVYRLGFISKNGFSNDISKEKYIIFELNDFYKF